jgi:hypothetical protein
MELNGKEFPSLKAIAVPERLFFAAFQLVLLNVGATTVFLVILALFEFNTIFALIPFVAIHLWTMRMTAKDLHSFSIMKVRNRTEKKLTNRAPVKVGRKYTS